MYVAHELLRDVKVGQPVEEAVDVQACSWILNWPCITNQFAVIIGLLHIDF